MMSLNVELGARSYPIHVGTGLLGRGELVRAHVAGPQVMLVTNTTVGPLYLEKARAAFDGLETAELVLPDGEAHKTLAVVEQIFDELLERRFGRDCTLVAVGGGVVGDMTGFAAACYQRGVTFIQVPTTLLAQVDASVGGKTGVNHPLGKNMIGAFHQPACVVVDTETLNTLPDSELAAGLAEVVKYGLIRDAAFFDWLERNIEALIGREPEALTYAIRRSCENKAEVVSADEREGGLRALLNLGHTFGHAIETGLGHGQWLHGEAVAVGMCLAADLSSRLGWLSRDAVARTEALLARAALPVRVPPELAAGRLMDLMGVDKKVLGGRLRLVLLKGIGEAVVTSDFDQELLVETLEAHQAAA